MNHFIQPISEEYEKIVFVNGAREGKYPYSHSLLIEDFLIDTGISSRLLRKLKRHYPINNVILSHWHEDHTSGNRLLPNVKFYIHSKDKFLIENVNKFNEYYGISNSLAEEEFEWLVIGKKNLAQLHFLKQKGLTLVKVSRFRNSLFNLIIDTAFDVFL